MRKLDNQVIIWPTYFDVAKSRKEGRRVPKNCAVQAPKIVEIKEAADHVIYIPPAPEELAPILEIVPLQLLAYHIAVRRGCDVDQPRNLAKSVTVE